MTNDVKTTVFIMQTDGKETNLYIYGAKSIKELCEATSEAMKIEECTIHYVDDIDVLAKAMTA